VEEGEHVTLLGIDDEGVRGVAVPNAIHPPPNKPGGAMPKPPNSPGGGSMFKK
jgi:hypothetical protein